MTIKQFLRWPDHMLLDTETRHLHPLLTKLTFKGFSTTGLALEKQVTPNHSPVTQHFYSVTRNCVCLHLTHTQATKLHDIMSKVVPSTICFFITFQYISIRCNIFYIRFYPVYCRCWGSHVVYNKAH